MNAQGLTNTKNNSATDDAAVFLTHLGERIRNARARHGMTRKDLARHSGVSERYLAQLESGRGNISIVLLRQVATALAAPLENLVREGPEPTPELILFQRFLESLPDDDLSAARQMVERSFNRTDASTERLALIGLRGAGKTTVGRMIAEITGAPFCELATEIAEDAGMPLEEIFELYGQAGFRRFEQQALLRIIKENRRVVIATGGGIVAEPATYQSLLTECFTIWLQADPAEHMQRVLAQGDNRPMAGNRQAMSDLRRILRNRDSLYAKASAKIDTSDHSPELVAETAVTLWNSRLSIDG